MPDNGLQGKREEMVPHYCRILLGRSAARQLGLQIWAGGCEAALWDPYSSNLRGEKLRTVRRRGLVGGGALQTWGHPRLPVGCNQTPLSCRTRIGSANLGLFLYLPGPCPSPFT